MTAANDTTRVLDGLRRIVRSLRESSRAAEADLGVSGAQLFVVRALAEAPALSLNELAARTHTHQSTVSVVVKRLAARGLVARSISARDGRRLVLRLTGRGRALLARAPLAAQDTLIAGLASLTGRDRRALAAGLQRLVEAMRLHDAEPAMFFEE